ncbi:MAG: c-type cytochrome, partial [Planctomycetales bacterium]|nr:c-type cytochrome [Planctomycetales bacterium]
MPALTCQSYCSILVVFWILVSRIQPCPGQTQLPVEFKAEIAQHMVQLSHEQGQASRGAAIFASAQLACLSCHRINQHGGTIGPNLTQLATQRTDAQIVASVLWPNHEVLDPYRVVQVLTVDGEAVRGFVHPSESGKLRLVDPNSNTTTDFDLQADIEVVTAAPSIMPEGLVTNLTVQQQADLFAFLLDLGRSQRLRPEIVDSILATAQSHAPAPFPLTREPLLAETYPSWNAHVNRDRLYDFYTKEANYFRTAALEQHLLMEFPGLDGGEQGHWGNQSEATWASDDWNQMQLGSLQCGVFHGHDKLTVRRAVCVALGEPASLFVCFDPESLTYRQLWTGGFLEFSSVRHGFLDGLRPAGPSVDLPEIGSPPVAAKYLGYYRIGARVAFAYEIDGKEIWDAPWVRDGQFSREVAARSEHSLSKHLAQIPQQWPTIVSTQVTLGAQSPYAIDTIGLPYDNPWNSLMYIGDHDIDANGNIYFTTMQGDVWRAEPLSLTQTTIHWKRFAAGLHQPLGLKVDQDGI